MADGGLPLGGLLAMVGGVVLVYTGMQDTPGGPAAALRSVLAGSTPTKGGQTSTPAANLGSVVGGVIGGGVPGAGGGTGAGLGGAVAGAVGGRGKIIATAQTYLGVPYRFGGLSRNGIDCSGLVVRAYESVGIKLPHRASLIAAKGRRITLAEVLPGDLVAWGAPGNYPHCALAMNGTQVIVAPSTGKKVQYQKLWESKVPGFGKPDIYRLLGD